MSYQERSLGVLKETMTRLSRLYANTDLEPGKVHKIGLKPQWNVVIGSTGQCGMAINFTGIHNVSHAPGLRSSGTAEDGGARDSRRVEFLQSFVGKSLMELAESSLLSGNLCIRSVGVAALSALSQPFLVPDSLRSRGFHLQEGPGPLGDLIRVSDILTVVGYGGLVRGMHGKCKELHVTEMRPKEGFLTTIIGEEIEYGPQALFIHSDKENEAVLGRSDLIIMTGSILVNGTFAELMAYSRRARSIGLYGPSASLVPDVLFERGVDFVMSHRIRDPARFEYDMINDIDMETALKTHQARQVVWAVAREPKSYV